MKKYFFMDCKTVLDTAYVNEEDLSIFTQILIGIHLMSCTDCARELKNLRHIHEIMKTDFLPPSPNFEGLIMERLYEENGLDQETDAPAGFSFIGWVTIGFFILFSLSSSFFGVDFIKMANTEGLSFLLPVGITIGIVLTCYGAVFIGSHLKELSARFKLH